MRISSPTYEDGRNRLRAPVVVTALLAMCLFGLGCDGSPRGHSEGDAGRGSRADASGSGSLSTRLEDTSLNIVARFEDIPQRALATGVRTRRFAVRNTATISLIQDSLAQNEEFNALKEQLLGAGYAYEPRLQEFVTATEASGSPLVGLSYQALGTTKDRTAFLIAFYPATELTHPTPELSYAYLLDFDYVDGISFRHWFDGTTLQTYASETIKYRSDGW